MTAVTETNMGRWVLVSRRPLGTPSGSEVRGFGRVTSVALGVVSATQACAWLASRRAGRVNVVDVAWGPGIAGVATLSAVAGTGDRLRRVLLAAGTTAWGARLATHVHRRSVGRGEDPRYAEMLAGSGRVARIAKVFLTQAAGQWLVSVPIQVAAVTGPPRGPRGRIGLATGSVLMVGGGLTEAIADRQREAWKASPARGPVMDQGLWAWSRHPNYFGDACLWWGIFLIAAAARPGAWTVPSPAVMTWLLIAVTGARRAERMRHGDPDYADYQRRVSFFLPRPPR
jgi:steroid 5-alpha reductase family enzyme